MAKRSLSETEEQKHYNEDDEDGEEENDGEETDDEEVENGENVEEEEIGEKRERLENRFSSKGFSSSSSLSSQSRVCCQVSHCGQDLGEAKLYYRRHKVCEYHAKTVVVSINGIDRRFCQQCSRFHEISEFDDTKRSCRKRLAGHNERRRKLCADLQAEEEAVHTAPVSDVKDKSWRVRGHLEHLTTRVQGKPSYRVLLVRDAEAVETSMPSEMKYHLVPASA